jgi:hypothetical protein
MVRNHDAGKFVGLAIHEVARIRLKDLTVDVDELVTIARFRFSARPTDAEYGTYLGQDGCTSAQRRCAS